MGKPNNNQQTKPNQNKPPRKNKPSKLAQQAKRDVMIGSMPALNELQRLQDQARMDYQNQNLGVQSVFAGSGELLAGLPEQYQNATQDIQQNLQNQLTQFQGGLNAPNVPQAEQAAATGLYGATGSNAFAELASQAQRNMGYNQSAQRENSLSNRYAQLNLSQNLEDQLKEYYNRRVLIKDQMRPQILSRLDQLRDEKSQEQSDAAFNQLLQSLIGQQLAPAPGTPGPGKPGKPGDKPSTDPYANAQGTQWDALANQYVPSQGLQDRLAQLQARINKSEDSSQLPQWLMSALNTQTDPAGKRKAFLYNNITPPEWWFQPPPPESTIGWNPSPWGVG